MIVRSTVTSCYNKYLLYHIYQRDIEQSEKIATPLRESFSTVIASKFNYHFKLSYVEIGS